MSKKVVHLFNKRPIWQFPLENISSTLRQKWVNCILKDWHNYRSDFPDDFNPSIINNDFYVQQMKLLKKGKHLPTLGEDEDFPLLMKQFKESIKNFLADAPDVWKFPPTEIEKIIQKEIYFWITILHAPQGVHKLHMHEDSIVSGVYYLQVPENSGCIRFGGGPKEELILKPKAGEVVLFPSYMRHEVLPCENSDLRMSLAFNLKGDALLLQK